MAIAALVNPGNNAKISDLNTLITAINTELGLYATKASVDALTTRVTTLEGKVTALEGRAIPPDLTVRVKALEDKPAPVMPPDLTARVVALETEADPVIPPDLTGRVEVLEETVATLRTPVVSAAGDTSMISPIPHRRRDPAEGVELIYDKATIYLGDMELHALRVAENTWRLVAQLNYITVSQIIWTYDETVTGTVDDIYRHAVGRLQELAQLKVAHDAAHKRVREMSEGRP